MYYYYIVLALSVRWVHPYREEGLDPWLHKLIP